MSQWEPGYRSAVADYEETAGGGNGQTLGGTNGTGTLDQSFLELMVSTDFGPGAATEEQINSIVQSFKEEPVSEDDANVSALLLEDLLSARQGTTTPVPWSSAFQPPSQLPPAPQMMQTSLQSLPPGSLVPSQAACVPHLPSASPLPYHSAPSAVRRMSPSQAAGYGAVQPLSIPAHEQPTHPVSGPGFFPPTRGRPPGAHHELERCRRDQQHHQQLRIHQIQQQQQQQIIHQQRELQQQELLRRSVTPTASRDGFARTPSPGRVSPSVGGVPRPPSTLAKSTSLPLAATVPHAAAMAIRTTPAYQPAAQHQQKSSLSKAPSGFAVTATSGARHASDPVNDLASTAKPLQAQASQPAAAKTRPAWKRLEGEGDVLNRDDESTENPSKRQRIESSAPPQQLSIPKVPEPSISTVHPLHAQAAQTDLKPSPIGSSAAVAGTTRKPPPPPSVPAGLSLPRSGVFAPTPLQTPGGPSSVRSKLREDPVSEKRKLFDVTADAGVDLEAEQEEMVARRPYRHEYPVAGDRIRKQTFFNEAILKKTLEKIGKSYAVSNINPDVIAYIGLAAESHLRDLLERMIDASKHRVGSQAHAPPPMQLDKETGRPVPVYKIVVQQDVKRQLLALERAEREEERGRKKARTAPMEGCPEEGSGAGLESIIDGLGELGSVAKKSKQKASASRNMPEDLRKRISDQTALMSAGLVQRSWMVAGVTGSGQSQTQSRAAAPLLRPSRTHAPRRVTARDALFTLEQDGGSAIGRSAVDRILIKAYPRWLR